MDLAPLLHALMIIIGFGIVFLIIMGLEHYYLIKQKQEAYDLKETIANIFSAVLYKTMDGIYLIFFLGIVASWIKANGLGWNVPITWWSILLIFIAQDFFFYFAHLFAHKFRIGWVTHKIHHSSKHFNFGVALRQSLLAPIPLFGIFSIVWLPFVFMGVDIKVVAFIYELNLFYQFFIHTKTIDRLPKWYEAVFNTPAHHRVHHGCAESQIDTNFGGVFILWDRLFGTFKDEAQVKPIVFGVKSRPITTNNVVVMIFEELIDLIKTTWKAKDLRVLFRHPDWKSEESEK